MKHISRINRHMTVFFACISLIIACEQNSGSRRFHVYTECAYRNEAPF